MKHRGKFWPPVRSRIWLRAQKLFQEDQVRTMHHDFKAITATKRELREGGYFYEAKLLVLREVNRERRGLPPEDEEELMKQFSEQ